MQLTQEQMGGVIGALNAYPSHSQANITFNYSASKGIGFDVPSGILINDMSKFTQRSSELAAQFLKTAGVVLKGQNVQLCDLRL